MRHVNILAMNVVREIRAKKGLSQRAFARKASLSFRGLQLLEEQEHDRRISSVRKIAAALDLPASGVDMMLKHFLNQDHESVMMVSIRIQSDGFASWPLHLFNFVDAFRSLPSAAKIESPPVYGLDVRIKCLLASTVESLCSEKNITIPEWCFGVRGLEQPWFVAGIEALKATALVESPVRFRKRNVFVLENFLDRA